MPHDVAALLNKMLEVVPTQTDLAKRLSDKRRQIVVTQPQISRWRKGQMPETENYARIVEVAETMGVLGDVRSEDMAYLRDWAGNGSKSTPADTVNVVGEVAAGRFVEFTEAGRIDFEPHPSPFPPVPGYPIEAQFDLRVSGNSINKLAADGDFLRCVSLDIHPVEVHNDDFVIFERLREGGHLREVTAKRIRHRGKTTELLSYSTDPQWQTPIALPYGEFEGEEGRIVALILYAYRPTRAAP